MILLLHHRYRHAGGEERAVEDLQWLIREHLGEDVEVLERRSADVSSRDAALGLLRGGLRPEEVGEAVRRTGARVVHAHNVNPTYGARALEAARAAGARVVLHLHNYRLVCAVGTCFTRGEDCTRCHGRNTLPGLKLNCRGGSRAESAAYAAGLAVWQRRLTSAADAIVVPSAFALDRLRTLGAPVEHAQVLSSVQRTFASRSGAAGGEFVLAAGRLTPEKGFADVVEACVVAGLPLVVAGDGPERAALERRAAAAERGDDARAGVRGAATRFVGHVSSAELATLRERAAVAVVPVALRGDPPPGGAGGDGGRAADGRGALGRARRGGARGGSVSGRGRQRSRRAARRAFRRRRRRRAGTGRRPRAQRSRGHRTCVERHLRPQLHIGG